MNRDQLRQTCDTLETFLLLKRQNSLIYAWMELKKRHKCIASLRGSRTSSIFAPSSSSKHTPLQTLRPNPQPSPHPLKELAASKPQNHSTPRIVRKQVRLATENCAPNEAFETFNRQEGNRHTLTEKFSREQLEHLHIHTQNEEEEGDSDEFEDIVLDRLSKLEENINRLMREKRAKDQQRGYVGTPVSPQFHSNPHPQVHYETNYDRQLPPEERAANGYGSILERKRKFFEGLQQSQEEGKNIIYNLKYIPQQGNSPSIQKIRRMFQQRSQEDNFIDGVDYFIAANPRAQEGDSRDRTTSSHYQRRNGGPHDPRAHFSHLQMQTVIEPPRRRYYRNSFNSSNSGDPHIKIEELQKSQVSRKSEYSAKVNNLSAYY